MATTHRAKPKTREEVLQRYPRLTAHLICASLGYFTPGAAAGAILDHIQGEPNYCELMTHLAGRWSDEAVKKACAKLINQAFQHRHTHVGYMASYQQARLIVERVRQGGEGPIFMSW